MRHPFENPPLLTFWTTGGVPTSQIQIGRSITTTSVICGTVSRQLHLLHASKQKRWTKRTSKLSTKKLRSTDSVFKFVFHFVNYFIRATIIVDSSPFCIRQLVDQVLVPGEKKGISSHRLQTICSCDTNRRTLTVVNCDDRCVGKLLVVRNEIHKKKINHRTASFTSQTTGRFGWASALPVKLNKRLSIERTLIFVHYV